MTANMGVGLTYMFDQSFGLTLKAKRKVFSPDVTKLFDKSVTNGDYVNQFCLDLVMHLVTEILTEME